MRFFRLLRARAAPIPPTCPDVLALRAPFLMYMPILCCSSPAAVPARCPTSANLICRTVRWFVTPLTRAGVGMRPREGLRRARPVSRVDDPVQSLPVVSATSRAERAGAGHCDVMVKAYARTERVGKGQAVLLPVHGMDAHNWSDWRAASVLPRGGHAVLPGLLLKPM